jgi:beta-galactosidase/beta-glucuronidase
MKKLMTLVRVAGLAALVVTTALLGKADESTAQWKPAASPLLTPWAKDVTPDKVWPEYPRPQMVRAEWVNLNGLWDYAIILLPKTSGESGQKLAENDQKPPAVTYTGRILVPFPIESALSGVRKQLLPTQLLVYRRAFQAPRLENGKRLLLHFGAVDWEAKVYINGKQVGSHRGGYDAFTFDITEAVRPGADNEIIVVVFDPTNGTRGKQNLGSMFNPGGIMYTPCSGIWQTVWLEPVPACRIEELQITPDVDAGVLRLKVRLEGGTKDTPRVEATALDGDRVVARASGAPRAELCLALPAAHLWSPDDPFLYGLKVKAGDDEITSYFGMRKIALGKDERGVTRMLLNGKFVFQAGVLDQGYWPDGIYLAPTDEALRFDVATMRKLGLNMARKHVKVEPQRWYYWCDKLGLLVWQDMPSGDISRGNDKKKDGKAKTDEMGRQFQAELKAMIEQHGNHPSIIMWVVFNEGWGQHDTAALTKWVKELDPSRLVNDASGWHDRRCGDIIDMHRYPGPGSPAPEPARAAVLGEFGGLGLAIPDHIWTPKSWGYKGMPSRQALTKNYVDLWRKVHQLKDESGLSAAVYTQWTDVEAECNGLLTYDRKVVKVDEEQAKAAHHGKVAQVK